MTPTELELTTKLIRSMISMAPTKRVEALSEYFLAIDAGWTRDQIQDLLEPYRNHQRKLSENGTEYAGKVRYLTPAFCRNTKNVSCITCRGAIEVGDAMFMIKRGKYYEYWHVLHEPKNYADACKANLHFQRWCESGKFPALKKTAAE